MPRITKRFVDALRPGKRDVVHWDEDLARFGVRVKPSGAMTYVVQYRNSAGRTRKLALGRVGVLTPEEARQKARKALGEVAHGGESVHVVKEPEVDPVKSPVTMLRPAANFLKTFSSMV